MNDVDAWIYIDGPEPEHIRPLLDELRDLPPLTPEEKARIARRLFGEIDAMLGYGEAPEDEAPRREADPHAPPIGGAVLAGVRGVDPSCDGVPSWGPSPLSTADVPSDPLSASALVPLSTSVPSASAPPPRKPPEPAAMPPARERAPAAFAETAAMSEDAAIIAAVANALPFGPASPDRPRAPPTVKLPVWRDSTHRETLPIGDESISKAIAALPFLGNTVGTGIVPFPRMSLDQYAWFRAELVVFEERSADILLKYRVLNDAARGALEEHWRKHFDDHPEERTAFVTTLNQLTKQMRGWPAWQTWQK
jgi:hypothetical protein